MPQGSVVSGQEIKIAYGIIDNDGNTANATNTIRIVDGMPIARDDFDTMLPSASATSKFFDGNVLNAISTDGGGTQISGFSTGASGADYLVNNADVSSIKFKGATFNLTTASSGTLAGGTYSITAAGELTWTNSTDASNVLLFQRDGYYKYTPPAINDPAPPQTVVPTVSFANSAALATAAGITLQAFTRLANINNAPDSTVTFSANGAGVNGGNSNARVDNLEDFGIVFNAANFPQGVQNVSITINAANSDLGDNGFGGIGALQYSIYDIAGNLLGQFASASLNVITIPTAYSNIGKILIEANSSTIAGTGSTAGSATIQSVTYNKVNVDTVTPIVPEEVIQYTITSHPTLSAPIDSSASLTLHTVTNESVGTAGNDTINGTASNDFISGLAGNDTISGGAGNDIIRGGAGDDTIMGGSGNNQLYGGDGNDTITITGAGNNYIYGDAGNDNLTGGGGNDIIRGGTGNDTINGGAGNDLIIGGAGNDTLTGGAGIDTFKWELADKGAVGTPASDTVTDFNVASVALGGDVLDLRDLLVGENHTVGVGNLASYMHFEKIGADTIVHLTSSGAYAAGFDATKDIQVITLTAVDLVTGFANDQAIIQDLLTKNKLITD